MVPAHAPLPTDSSFPFHPDSGSHTSIRISESLAGVNVAATRQNAGTFLNTSAPRTFAVKAPGPTDFVSVIVVWARLTLRTASQDAPAAEIEYPKIAADSR